MFGNSFAWWLVTTGIGIFWLALAIWSGSYFLAIGTFVFIALAFLCELPETDSLEGSADESSPLADT
jgi:hypothetical protein